MSVGTRVRAVLTSLASVAALALSLAPASPAQAATAAPATPTQLYNNYRSCSTDPERPARFNTNGGALVEAIAGGTGATSATLHFEVRPVSDPAQTTTVDHAYATLLSESISTFPASTFTDGDTYEWRVRTVMGSEVSDWSDGCYFTVDNAAPAQAPTVTSANYPDEAWSDGGAPVEFTFSADGDPDVVGFVFGWGSSLPGLTVPIGEHGVPAYPDPYENTANYVRADAPGGTATVRLVPTHSGPATLTVRSLDRADNRSSAATYTPWIRNGVPSLAVDPESAGFGDRAALTLSPDPALQAVSPVVGYAVTISGEGSENRTVQLTPDADGTAELPLVISGYRGETVSVTSTSANGWVSDSRSWSPGHYDSTPVVTSDVYAGSDPAGGVGVPGTFTFTAPVGSMTAWTYDFVGMDGASHPVTVPADQDGTASVSWAPTEEDFYDLVVYGTTDSGVRTAPYVLTFMVA